jgi:hypothetical protein
VYTALNTARRCRPVTFFARPATFFARPANRLRAPGGHFRPAVRADGDRFRADAGGY